MPSKIMFRGKSYFFNSNYDTKKEAIKQAKFIRGKKRRMARIVKRTVGDRLFWTVYARIPQ